MNRFVVENNLNRALPATVKPRSRLTITQRILSIGLLSSFSAGAFAHPGHSDGFLAAFAHPFTGLDHLLMMLFVGVWAGRSGGVARWLLPATFLASMLGGWMLGTHGVVLPIIGSGIESGIAATLIVLGVLLVLQVRLARAVQMVLVAGFALLHGLAHGSELTAGNAGLSAAGMLLATAVLHGIGIAATLLVPARYNNLYRMAGAALALVGGGLLATA